MQKKKIYLEIYFEQLKPSELCSKCAFGSFTKNEKLTYSLIKQAFTDEKRHFAYLGLYVQLGKLPPSVFFIRHLICIIVNLNPFSLHPSIIA